MNEIRPEVLGLVEAYGIPDNSLNSAIGMSDGKPYENLWKWTVEGNEWNQVEVVDGFLENWEGIKKARK